MRTEDVMEAHLTDEQFTSALLGDVDAGIRGHVESCPACAGELRRLRRALAGFREDVRRAGERPETFWRTQRQAMMAELRPRVPWTPRLAWAAGLGLAALAALWLGRGAPPSAPAAGPDPDHQLLVEVERSIRRELPEAFEPAALLTTELARAAESGR